MYSDPLRDFVIAVAVICVCFGLALPTLLHWLGHALLWLGGLLS